MEDEGIEEEEIELQTEALRRKLSDEDERGGRAGGGSGGKSGEGRGKGLKVHQVHELAKAKIEESERLRRALGIREDYEEGGHWKGREERLREGVREEGKRDGGGGERERY